MALKNEDKKDWAKTLFLREGLTAKDIAIRIKVTEKTIGVWREKGNWDTLRANLAVTKAEQLYHVNQQLNELLTHIRNKEEGKRYASSTEADTLSKLAGTKKSLETETSISDVVNVFVGFNDWLRTVDLDKAKEFIILQDGFVKTLLK